MNSDGMHVQRTSAPHFHHWLSASATSESVLVKSSSKLSVAVPPDSSEGPGWSAWPTPIVDCVPT